MAARNPGSRAAAIKGDAGVPYRGNITLPGLHVLLRGARKLAPGKCISAEDFRDFRALESVSGIDRAAPDRTVKESAI